MRGVFPEGFDGLPLLLGGVASGSFVVLVSLQDLFGLVVDFCTVLSYSILTKFITDSFSYCNVFSQRYLGWTYSILAKEVEYLCKVLCYNHYPQWIINKWGKSDQSGPLLHPETGDEIKKQFFISVPYFLGLSEAYKKIFKYTHIQDYFKGVNMLKSVLMHPKDKVSSEQKKDLVYHWQCQADGCKSSYVRETSHSLGDRAEEHAKSTMSAIHKHCTDFHHPLPSVTNFAITDKDSSQVTREAKEAIHIQRLDPDLNRNIGKMFIPCYFDPLIGVKPKHPRVDHLSQLPGPVDELAPPSQIPGLNLTQFDNFRPNPHAHIPRHSMSL